MKLSSTAVKHGYGAMPYRWVSGLTKEERDLVRAGELCYFKINKTHYSQSGYKVVTLNYHRFDSREPNGRELALILIAEKEVKDNG